MIELAEVVKAYRARGIRRSEEIRALDGVSLAVEPGTAIGIVGLNGAGKSTLLRVLLGYARPTSGTVKVGGLRARTYAERHGVAYVPERVTLPRAWTVRGAMRAFAMLGNLGDDAWEQVEAAIERLGLQGLAERQVRALSKGNLQRLALAQALLGDRQLMVLDEPTDGLDPVWIVKLRELVTEWRSGRAERVVVLASHNLAEVARLCDRVILLHNGRIQGDLPLVPDGAELERSFLSRLSELEEARA